MSKKIIVRQLPVILAILFFSFTGCSKNNSSNSSLYTPTSSDVTATATLADLQQGRALYIANCGSCHGLYSPDSYTSSQWKSVMTSMGAKASLTSTDQLLITKYVTKGK